MLKLLKQRIIPLCFAFVTLFGIVGVEVADIINSQAGFYIFSHYKRNEEGELVNNPADYTQHSLSIINKQLVIDLDFVNDRPTRIYTHYAISLRGLVDVGGAQFNRTYFINPRTTSFLEEQLNFTDKIESTTFTYTIAPIGQPARLDRWSSSYENINLIANEKYTIEVYSVYGVGLDLEGNYSALYDLSSVTIDYSSVPLPAEPQKDGYSFGGWFLDEQFNVPYVNQAITDDTQLYAKMIPIIYTITYTLNGGTLESMPITYDVTQSIILPIPARDGYVFLGWRLASDNSEITVIPAGTIGDISLIAEWEIITCLVTFYLDGEIYVTMIVDWGTTFFEAIQAQQAILMRNLILSEDVDLTTAIIEDTAINIELNEGTFEKIGAKIDYFLANQWGWLVAGSAAIVFLLIIFGSNKHRARGR